MAAKDGLIQQKEKLYVELKSILARQPGPEVAEQLQIYQDNLSEKQKQLKAMTAELNMHRGQVTLTLTLRLTLTLTLTLTLALALTLTPTTDPDPNPHQVSDLKLDQENLVSQLGQIKKKYFSRKQQERRQYAMYGNYMEPPPQGTAEYDFGGEGGEGEPPGAAGGGGGAAALGVDLGAQ